MLSENQISDIKYKGHHSLLSHEEVEAVCRAAEGFHWLVKIINSQSGTECRACSQPMFPRVEIESSRISLVCSQCKIFVPIATFLGAHMAYERVPELIVYDDMVKEPMTREQWDRLVNAGPSIAGSTYGGNGS